MTDDRSVIDALRAGARGYLTKDAGAEEIREALQRVTAGQAAIDPAVQHHLVSAIATSPSTAATPQLPAGLTQREAEVLALIAQGEWPGGIAPPGSRRVKWTAGEVPLAGSFSVGLFPNRACKFPRTLLSSDHFGCARVAGPAGLPGWRRGRVTGVCPPRMAIKCIPGGLSRGPGWTRSASLRTWWPPRPAVSSQISQRPARSRKISSLRRVLAMTGRWSVTTAVRARRSGIPPKPATSGSLPLSRFITTCRHLRRPTGD